MAKVIASSLGIELHGKVGNAVFAMTKNGLVLRPRTQPRDPRTPAQQASRARLARVSETWKTLTPAQRAAWQQYAQTVSRFHPFGGPPYHPAPQTLFIGLGSKYLQVHPNAAIPLLSPAYPFFGDGITVTVTGIVGAVLFTAGGPNAAGIVTELLLQPLANGGRAPKANLFRTQKFVGFAGGSLSSSVPAAPGWYAPAFRFVNSATGQEAGRVMLAAVQVV